MQALIGQRLSSDFNLAAQILILIGLWIGFLFARRKQFKHHQAIQTTMVVVNSFLILFVMVTSLYNYVIAGGTTTGVVATLMMAHGVVGLVAELTGIYLILRMSTHLLPERLRVRNFKMVMRVLLGLWTLIVVGGVGIYYYRYLAPKPTTTNPMAPLARAVDDIQIHSDEMASALQRGNLTTAKRHAEHLVNLIVGKGSADYGDVDGNGTVEDPGDGTGAVVYLESERKSVSQGGSDPVKANTLLNQMDAAMIRVAADAKQVLLAQNASGLTQPAEDASALASELRDASNGLIGQLAAVTGAQVPPAASAMNAPGTGTAAAAPPGNANASSVTVVMQNISFNPKTIQVKAGAAIVFVNRDAAKHTVTSDTGKFNSGDIASGQSFSLKLDEPGTYPYYCEFHGDKGGVDMAGTIVVTP
ncbi:MAG: cupredoxin domain-containing protein [Anaerolineaceae bacterium]|nr:cupredoxin domain-containing protein [Anaerolineaceae bacterium]